MLDFFFGFADAFTCYMVSQSNLGLFIAYLCIFHSRLVQL
jgi:hypothetical protein